MQRLLPIPLALAVLAVALPARADPAPTPAHRITYERVFLQLSGMG
jgi:hypothetical protein